MAIPLAVVALLATTAFTARSQKAVGRQQNYDLERQAEQEKLSAEGEELQRRERLNKVLAANVASVSKAGLTGESLKSVSLETARRASTSEGAESLSDRLRQDILKREGKRAKKAGSMQAASTLLSGISAASQLITPANGKKGA